jgi:hypothetical protein
VAIDTYEVISTADDNNGKLLADFGKSRQQSSRGWRLCSRS